MALDTIVAGPYGHTYGGVSTGISRDGYRIDHVVEKQPIKGDLYGESVIDFISRGGNVFLDYTCIAWKAGTYYPLLMFGQNFGEMWAPGLVESAYALATVLTAVQTPGAVQIAATPTTITASKTTLAPGHSFITNLQTLGREAPIRLQCLPYVSGVTRWYTLA